MAGGFETRRRKLPPQDVERRIVKEASDRILELGLDKSPGIVVAGRLASWVIGIVASRLVEVLSPDNRGQFERWCRYWFSTQHRKFSMYEGLRGAVIY